MGAAEWTGVFIGDEDEASLFTCGKNGVERGRVFNGFIGFIEFAVAVVDGDLVPDADIDGVALREIGDAVLVEGDPGVGVVHDGDGLFGCVGEADAAKLWARPRVCPVSCAASWRVRWRTMASMGSEAGGRGLPSR